MHIFIGGIRVCTFCGKVALSALRNDPTGDLDVQQEDFTLSMENSFDSVTPSGSAFWANSTKRSSSASQIRPR